MSSRGTVKALIFGAILVFFGFGAVIFPNTLIGSGKRGIFAATAWVVDFFPEGAQRWVARCFGLVLGCLGALLLCMPFAGEIEAARYEAGIESGDAAKYTTACMDAMRKSAPAACEVFATEEELQFCLLNAESFHCAVVDVDGAFMDDTEVEKLAPTVWSCVKQAWEAPANLTFSNAKFVVGEETYDPTTDEYLQSIRPMPSGEKGDYHLGKASEAWKAKDKERSLRHAHEALYIRRKLRGDNDPSVAEVQKMITFASANQP